MMMMVMMMLMMADDDNIYNIIYIIILFKVGLFTYSSIITNLNQLFTKNTATNRNYTNLQFWLFTDPAITLIAKPVLL